MKHFSVYNIIDNESVFDADRVHLAATQLPSVSHTLYQAPGQDIGYEFMIF